MNMLFPESLKLVSGLLNKVKKNDMDSVIEDLFTAAEIVDMADRILLLQQLQDGKTQREISRDLGVSVTTVSRGSRILKFGRGTIGKYI